MSNLQSPPGPADDDTMTLDPESLDEEGFPIAPYSEVVSGLFQASTELSPLQLFTHGFDAVFDLSGRDRGDDLADETYVVHAIDDVPWISEPESIHRLGAQVAELVRSGKKVVVNCMSGLNRSGLLVARALIELGHAPLEAVELVRRARGPHALSNRQFMRFLVVDCTPRMLAKRRRADPLNGSGSCSSS